MKGRQMYKIYVNETKVLLLPSSDYTTNLKTDKDNLVILYMGKPSHILNFIDMFEKSKRIKSLVLHYPNFKKLKEDFLGLFRVVEAAGGLVVNENNEILFIHRRGFWDLPKGKLDPEETRREAAKREVKEETGIRQVQLDKKLVVTNHTFKNGKGKRCIKKSHWYLMFAPNQKLIPQAEEDITKARWMTIKQFFSKERKVYRSILDVLESSITGVK